MTEQQEHEFAKWKLETLRAMVARRRLDLAKAEIELEIVERGYAARFGPSTTY
jgi:hypothetical protein